MFFKKFSLAFWFCYSLITNGDTLLVVFLEECWNMGQNGKVEGSVECGESMEDGDSVREMEGLGFNLCVALSPENQVSLIWNKWRRQRWVVFCKGTQQLQAREAATNQEDFYTTGLVSHAIFTCYCFHYLTFVRLPRYFIYLH